MHQGLPDGAGGTVDVESSARPGGGPGAGGFGRGGRDGGRGGRDGGRGNKRDRRQVRRGGGVAVTLSQLRCVVKCSRRLVRCMYCQCGGCLLPYISLTACP